MNWYHDAIPVERDYQKGEAYRRAQKQRLVKEATGARPRWHVSLRSIFQKLAIWTITHLPQFSALRGETPEINLEAVPEKSRNLS